MAQKVQVLLVDDLDGGQADETVSFGLDGVAYEIDLSASNATKLRESFADFVGAARKASKRSTGRSSGGRSPARADREQTKAIREWARGKGYQVSDRGRIPANIVEEYNASH